MATSNFHFLILLLSTFSYIRVHSHQGGYIAVDISSEGIDFIKDLLIQKAESSLVPLGLSDIKKSVKIPLIGTVHVLLSDITIQRIHLASSTVETGKSGFVVNVSGATANLSMNWKYWYRARFIPISISDKGSATVQVKGMEVGLTLSLKTVEGSLNVVPLECGCYVNDISIKMVGGASWLYQGLVDAFQSKIGSAVEDAVSKKISNRIVKLDSLLQSLPKQVPVTNIASLNTSFVNDPKLTESSVVVEIDGLLFAKHEIAFSTHYHGRLLKPSFSHEEDDGMAKVSLHENVLESASSVYFKAGKMQWVVDKVPDKTLLNTSGWRFIIPQLYKKYPNHSMNLNISVSSPPIIRVKKQQIMTTIPLVVVINVLDEEETIPVACISTVISSSLTAEFSGNSLAGNVKLNNFTMHLKWSEIGDLQMNLLQALISTVMRTLVLPYINLKLSNGYRIPTFHGYGLQDAHIRFMNSWIVICTDVAHVKQFSII